MDTTRQKSQKDVWNILLCGVGGQGVLVASDILIDVAMQTGFDVKKSEIHGMAQRGGSVVSQVRFGQKIYSPIIHQGEADVILSFEKIEALRYLDILKNDGIIIYNDQQITPLSVYFTDISYPENVKELYEQRSAHLVQLDAIAIAEEIGNPKVINSVMLGALSNYLDFDPQIWLDVITKRVPPKTTEINKIAFYAGRKE
ncbi:indolepyruvate oxidoreductase subunit beta [candidate division KSB1 bacterium]|nr:indolepyruvate oxidoreductase subunit beta [candidate division KSB1 bacterium]